MYIIFVLNCSRFFFFCVCVRVSLCVKYDNKSYSKIKGISWENPYGLTTLSCKESFES